MVGESARAVELGSGFYKRETLALLRVFPIVTCDEARIRNMTGCRLTKEQLDAVLHTYDKVGKRLRII